MLKVVKNYPLKKFTKMAMGGPASYFIIVKSEKELITALNFAKQKRLPWYAVGEGSNLIVADEGFKGIIIEIRNSKFEIRNEMVTVGAGHNLLSLIHKLNRKGLSGMEKMAGIPGTVGGAIYGCAGAYGQEIKDWLVSVRVFDGQKFRVLSRKQCKFGYRESIFKKRKDWIITAATFRLKNAKKEALLKTSKAIIKLREKKYPPGLKCPGSFFKNIKVSDIMPDIRKKFLRVLPKDKIMYGKVPVGYLLEEVGAKGMRFGKIKVAKHHANLIYNPDGGKASDVKKLAKKLKALVKNIFFVRIEEEVQYLGFN